MEDENEIAKSTRKAALLDRARLFRELFSTAQGKTVFDVIKHSFGYDSTAGIPPNRLDDHGRTDELQTHRKIGEYAVIRWIEIQIEMKETNHVDASSSRP